MQILITQGALARTRVVQVNTSQVVAGAGALLMLLLMLSGAVYHYFFLKAAREGWPVVSQLVKLVVHDEIAQRDRFMRENLDAMARKVGDMQARLVKLQAMGDRVSSMAGLKPEDLRDLSHAAAGGPFIPLAQPSLPQLKTALIALSDATDDSSDLLTLAESRLLESRLLALMIPSSRPIEGPVGSGFGFRPDPFTGRGALHTGLDFPSDVGTAIHAAAGGVVHAAQWHPEYGQMLEIDHGHGLMTRYGHTSRIFVKEGELVQRGQVVANVGTTGRSTGPHLHFEVLVDGVPQDPQKFLAGSAPIPDTTAVAGAWAAGVAVTAGLPGAKLASPESGQPAIVGPLPRSGVAEVGGAAQTHLSSFVGPLPQNALAHPGAQTGPPPAPVIR